jgi:hypothetical protein
MSTEPQRTCPSCGHEFSGAMEFCPVCVLRKALAAGVESGGSSASEDPVEPKTPERAVQRFEHYELVTGRRRETGRVGSRAMGVTYKAFDVDLHCPVTLKVISERYLGDESARLRFLREARAAARCCWRNSIPNSLWLRSTTRSSPIRRTWPLSILESKSWIQEQATSATAQHRRHSHCPSTRRWGVCRNAP